MRRSRGEGQRQWPWIAMLRSPAMTLRVAAQWDARSNLERACEMTKKPRSAADLSTPDEHLETDGKREDFQAVAIKEVLAWQIEQAMKAQKLSRKRLAERMGTSRSQVGRLLDPKDGNVTLTTLQRAAAIVGRKVRLELV